MIDVHALHAIRRYASLVPRSWDPEHADFLCRLHAAAGGNQFGLSVMLPVLESAALELVAQGRAEFWGVGGGGAVLIRAIEQHQEAQ